MKKPYWRRSKLVVPLLTVTMVFILVLFRNGGFLPQDNALEPYKSDYYSNKRIKSEEFSRLKQHETDNESLLTTSETTLFKESIDSKTEKRNKKSATKNKYIKYNPQESTVEPKGIRFEQKNSLYKTKQFARIKEDQSVSLDWWVTAEGKPIATYEEDVSDWVNFEGRAAVDYCKGTKVFQARYQPLANSMEEEVYYNGQLIQDSDCGREEVLGYTDGGRPLKTFSYGFGDRVIFFYAAMHGSEANTRDLLKLWQQELRRESYKIPKDTKVVVVPRANPDGIANGSRFNSNGVDINRNFDTDNWQADSYIGSYLIEGGGGEYPFSEKETRLIRDVIQIENPELSISYHSAASYVIPNNLQISQDYGQIYAAFSNYYYVPPAEGDDAFTYTITGAFGDWADDNGYPSLTIELESPYDHELNRNIDAMWYFVQNR